MNFARFNVFLFLLSLAALVTEIGAFLGQQAGYIVDTPVYRLAHLTQIFVLLVITWVFIGKLKKIDAQVWHTRRQWLSIAWRVWTALLLSWFGDWINSGLLPLEDLFRPRAILSIPFFLIAHILYISCFWDGVKTLRSPESKEELPIEFQKLRRRLFLYLPLLTFIAWSLVIPVSSGHIVFYSSLIYACAVMAMFLSAYWFSRHFGPRSIVVVIGGALFVVSDGMIAFGLSGHVSFLFHQGVWLTYILAQIGIVQQIGFFRHGHPQFAIQ